MPSSSEVPSPTAQSTINLNFQGSSSLLLVLVSRHFSPSTPGHHFYRAPFIFYGLCFSPPTPQITTLFYSNFCRLITSLSVFYFSPRCLGSLFSYSFFFFRPTTRHFSSVMTVAPLAYSPPLHRPQNKITTCGVLGKDAILSKRVIIVTCVLDLNAMFKTYLGL